MIRFERDDTGIIVLVTDAANGEMAQLEDEGLGQIVLTFDECVQDDDGLFRVPLPVDNDDLEDVSVIVGDVDALAAAELIGLMS